MSGRTQSKLRHDILERELNRYKAIAAANKLKVISGQKETKESTLHSVTAEITTFDGERSNFRTKLNFGIWKIKINDRSQWLHSSKIALDTEIATAMEQYEIDNSAISASKKELSKLNLEFPKFKKNLKMLIVHEVTLILKFWK